MGRSYSGSQGAMSKPMPSMNAGYGLPSAGGGSLSAQMAPAPGGAAVNRMASQSKYSPSDWTSSNIHHYNTADASR